MGPRFIAVLCGLFAALAAETSSAQLVCVPGKGCSVEVKPPPVQWSPPPVQAGGGAQTQIPSTHVNPQWEAELARRARWEAYFSWRAKIELEARARLNARFFIDQLKFEARRSPDPYASQPAPYFAAPSDRRVKFPRVDIGFLGLCWGAYSGPGEPTYIGYCPAFRVRVSKRWGIAFDPAIVSAGYANLDFGMVGLRPGVQFSFVQGKRQSAASHAYVVAGLDVWLPFAEDQTPSAFFGGHAGLGAMISDGRWGIGFEVRGLVRSGFGNQDDPTARAMSSFRYGFEGRAPVIYVSFP